ncbi:hypothetical protein QPK24_11850 [Paenibacillus polygoni]|uniref:3-methyladenine DNA glycosylase AlkC n=1 Tax=Paenibacillus polygoni TaxID=3050112 RepID=A0ABY8X705_9BACL|nr:hypothetical protein [Paenibacillus polygoni]WIV21315.1 hypothetical protein QPK24_11850 [Paenibacillus polygoni]
MADPLKNVYDEAFLLQLGRKISAAYPPFQIDSFLQQVMDESYEAKALKERIRTITIAMGTFLPERYEDAIQILCTVSESCSGFPYLIMPDFVEVFGQEEQHWDLSMQALEKFTQQSSAEFAVRPFIIRHPEKMMEQMMKWSLHPVDHVRRLASEGCRPRLPWGQALTLFKQDPAPILPILEQLKADPSLYVRKSVANNLNDIAKDHPNIVIETARKWMGQHPYTDWIVRHGCRTLIRKAEPEVMALFGYAESVEGIELVTEAEITASPAALHIGENGNLSYNLRVREGDPARLRIEYGIDFVKSSGQVSRKKFLLSDKTVAGGTRISGSRKHRWADLTTRKHYAGVHRIVLLINGKEAASTEVNLKPPISKDELI